MINLIKEYSDMKFAYIIPKFSTTIDSVPIKIVGACYASLPSQMLSYKLTEKQLHLYDNNRNERITKPLYGKFVGTIYCDDQEEREAYIVECANCLIIIADERSYKSYENREFYELKNGELI